MYSVSGTEVLRYGVQFAEPTAKNQRRRPKHRQLLPSCHKHLRETSAGDKASGNTARPKFLPLTRWTEVVRMCGPLMSESSLKKKQRKQLKRFWPGHKNERTTLTRMNE